MKKNTVITIARQYGSGGHEVGRKVAELLGIEFYDKELIEMAAKRSGISSEALEHADETAANSLLYSLVMSSNFMYSNTSPMMVPINDKLFITQSQVVRELADKGPCIFVGRCADYTLADRAGCVKFFIYSDMEDRINRVVRRKDISVAAAKDEIAKNDKRRANYYNYYTGSKWGKIDNYDMCISTGKVGIQAAAEIIADYVSKA